MTRLYPQDDFLARIRILSPAEGGRRTPVINGIRWDFAYAEDGEKPQLSAIWPDFCDASGNSLASDAPLPTGTALLARMWIVFATMRVYHCTRLQPGCAFYCHEGARRVAVGRVIRLTGLQT